MWCLTPGLREAAVLRLKNSSELKSNDIKEECFLSEAAADFKMCFAIESLISDHWCSPFSSPALLSRPIQTDKVPFGIRQRQTRV